VNIFHDAKSGINMDQTPVERPSKSKYWSRWTDDPAMILASAAALIVLVFYTCYTRQLVLDGRTTTQKQMRAYVFLHDIRLEKRNDDSFDIIPEWENTGVSETRNMRAHNSRYMSDIELPNGFSFGDMPAFEVPIILGPKSTSNITFETISRTCLAQFNRRDAIGKFYMWGWAKYGDTLTDDQHTTRFCWDIDQVVFSADGNSARLSHGLCGEGNCSDKDCPLPEKLAYQIRNFECKGELPGPTPNPNPKANKK
jgi:hypothetical protein